MGRKSVAVLPQTQAILEQLGEQIKLARLRRHLSAELVAERAGVSRATVWNVEKGNPSVAIGTKIFRNRCFKLNIFSGCRMHKSNDISMKGLSLQMIWIFQTAIYGIAQ